MLMPAGARPSPARAESYAVESEQQAVEQLECKVILLRSEEILSMRADGALR